MEITKIKKDNYHLEMLRDAEFEPRNHSSSEILRGYILMRDYGDPSFVELVEVFEELHSFLGDSEEVWIQAEIEGLLFSEEQDALIFKTFYKEALKFVALLDDHGVDLGRKELTLLLNADIWNK
ncbi:hypothetical protein [Jeotgalibacillus sp. JSM ZJ347]|uniref:hypothetical protein n=1 Tax=Jeotgalibacillus sp. JSM ZJ347 TaxID=3342117 RepID=UPI0035A8C0B8